MPNRKSFDVLIIGGGQAGPPLAQGLARAGRRVALAERKNLGGSCVNFGCTPTKAAIASARVAHDARRARDFGVDVPRVAVDFPAVLRRAREILMESRRGLDRSFEGTDNPRLLRGHARLAGRDGEGFRVQVADTTVTAAHVVLDTGTRTDVQAIDGLPSCEYIHAGNWLDRPRLPSHLVVIGGGYIGLEMSQFYRRMGSRVTVIERSGRVARREDEDVASALQQALAAEGIEFRTETAIRGVRPADGGVRVAVEQNSAVEDIHASDLFLATGRRPNTDDLGLETVGVRVSERGIVETDRRLATNVDGVWAAGDIRGGPMFTHSAWDDHRVLMSQLAGDGTRTTDRVVPYAIFTDPELGRVGLTEAEARQAGHAIDVSRFEVSRNSKARELGDDAGFIKVVAEQGSGHILGAAVVSVMGAELVHLYTALMNARLPVHAIRDAIFIHPTLGEAVQSAMSSLGI